MTGTQTSTRTGGDVDSERLDHLGYRQELTRVLNLFQNFAVAFCYLSPLVGIYSLFALGAGAGGPRYLWLMPIVVGGQLMVALVFAELGSHYPIAGALFHWGKNLLGGGYGWWVGWVYGWALIITVASVDTGIAGYITTLVNNIFKTHLNGSAPNTILYVTLILLAIQTAFNVVGVRLLGLISQIGVYVEILGTLGVAALLAFEGFHHGFGYLFTTQGVQHAASNPFGVDFAGKWWLGAAFVAVLAHVYIFYGFESAGDVAEEVVDSSRRVPKAVISSLLVGGVTSFILVAALLLAIPGGAGAFGKAISGGVSTIISANVTSPVLQDVVLALVCFGFFSCGTAVQGAGARLVYSYARDGAVPGSRQLRKISPRFRTPVNALLVAAVIPVLFSLLAHYTPSKPVHVLWFVYPAKVNALFVLVSFGVSGIYLSFMMVVFAALVARLRGWRPQGAFRMGWWGYPVIVVGLVYGVAMLVNIVAPTGVNSPRGALFNYGWLTLFVMLVILLIGAVYFVAARPQRRFARRPPGGAPAPASPPRSAARPTVG
ncbi:MAG TPA: APC family permease [Acidimicrobiales bacterium]|nr:APC family permease [Acidimicrobiales bacterium]